MDYDAIRRRLYELEAASPSAEDRQEVYAALESKWEDVQVQAGSILAAWGGRSAVEHLRKWLTDAGSKEKGWTIRREAVKCLCRCYEAQDIPWLLDLYFESEDRFRRHEFRQLLITLPEGDVVNRIEAEMNSMSSTRRDAATTAKRTLDSWRQLMVEKGEQPGT